MPAEVLSLANMSKLAISNDRSDTCASCKYSPRMTGLLAGAALAAGLGPPSGVVFMNSFMFWSLIGLLAATAATAVFHAAARLT